MNYLSSHGDIHLQGIPEVRRKISRSLLLLKTEITTVNIDQNLLQFKIALKQKKNLSVQLYTLWTFEIGLMMSITV